MRVVGTEWGSRGQAIQLGALLLFAILIINLSLFQIFVVPNQNGEVEFKHSEQVRGQMVDYRTAVIRASGGGAEQAASVTLGPSYPSRTLFVNPGPPSGTLQAVGTSDRTVNASIANAVGLDNEVADFWNGAQRNYSTGALQYRAGYNYYENAPTSVYENTVMYDDFGSEQLNRTGQSLVSGRRITLIALQGDYQRSGSGTESVPVFPASTSEDRITVENAAGGNVSLEVPTRLSERLWVDLLATQFDPNAGTDPETCSDLSTPGTPADDGRYVVNCAYAEAGTDEEFATLRLWFEDGTYDVRLAKVTFGGDEGTKLGYVTRVDGHNEIVSEASTLQVVAEVRDEFNNPASGVDVIAETTGGTQGTVSPSSEVTDSDGRAQFVFDPTDDADTNDEDATVVVCVDGTAGGGCSNEPPRNRSTFSIDVLDDDSSSGGGGGSTSASQVSYGGGLTGTSGGQLTFDIDNGGSSDVTVTDFSVADGSTSDQLKKGSGGDSGSSARELEITGGGTDGYAESSSGFTTDGTSNALDTSAVVSGSGSAAVDLEVFEETPGGAVDLSGISQVNGQGAADITVTLTFGDGSSKEFYFKL